MAEPMTGTCKEFDINKGYGTITGDDGINYFCHFSALQFKGISLDAGDKVSFTPSTKTAGGMTIASMVNRV